MLKGVLQGVRVFTVTVVLGIWPGEAVLRCAVETGVCAAVCFVAGNCNWQFLELICSCLHVSSLRQDSMQS